MAVCICMSFITACNTIDISKYWRDETADGITSIDELVKVTGSAMPAETVASLSEDKYAYAQLDEETKKVYDEILDAILKQSEVIGVDTLDTDVLNNAYESVLADYGGLFWVEGYTYTEYTRVNEIVGLEFAPKYTMDSEERKSKQEEIDQVVDEMLGGISVNDSDYDKAKYVYDILISEVEYNIEAEDSQNIISALLNKETVCRGYASATQYLLNMLNIQSAIVTGDTEGEAHAWNLVQLDGEYYYIDTTWGNSSYLNSDSEQQKFINYSYFAVTTDELEKTHNITTSMVLPDCTATTDNYFVKESLYFSDWNPYEVGDVFEILGQGESNSVSVKFSDNTLYNQAKEYFITDKNLAYYFSEDENIFYLEDEDQRVLTVTIE